MRRLDAASKMKRSNRYEPRKVSTKWLSTYMHIHMHIYICTSVHISIHGEIDTSIYMHIHIVLIRLRTVQDAAE